MTPTSAILRVYREDIIGSGSLTAAIRRAPLSVLGGRHADPSGGPMLDDGSHSDDVASPP